MASSSKCTCYIYIIVIVYVCGCMHICVSVSGGYVCVEGGRGVGGWVHRFLCDSEAP